jgi:peptidoglycan/LPS O-acetylase OafA/YrhL
MSGRWLVIVGLLCAGRRFLNMPSRSLTYLAEGSYPVYILHQAVRVLAFSLVRLDLPWGAQWVLLPAASVAVTFLCYEEGRWVRWLRFLFGMRPRARGGRLRPVPSPEAPAA